jgi:hypothetical protein
MDPRRRRDRVFDIPAKLDLERSARLALFGADAERARDRERRGPAARSIPVAAGAHVEPHQFSVFGLVVCSTFSSHAKRRSIAHSDGRL